MLLVAGYRSGQDGASRQYLHRGIAARAFQRRFELADHVKVVGANLVNGLLIIDLKRELLEEMKRAASLSPRARGCQRPIRSRSRSRNRPLKIFGQRSFLKVSAIPTRTGSCATTANQKGGNHECPRSDSVGPL